MPEENQKRWTRLVKRQSRTTWAVLGVALVALLLAVWWVPTIASFPGVTLSPGGENPDEQSSYDEQIEIEDLSTMSSIEGFFIIEVSCDDEFQVKAVYAQVFDHEGVIDIHYLNAYAQAEFMGPDDDDGPVGLMSWAILSDEDFDPEPGFESVQGYELLSQMEIDGPVGIPEGFVFRIGGVASTTANPLDDTLTVTVVLEVAEDEGDECEVTIISGTLARLAEEPDEG